MSATDAADPTDAAAPRIGEPEPLVAVGELVDATYRLNLAVATSDLDAAVLREARARLDEVSSLLEQRTRPRARRAPFDAPGRARATGTPYRLCALTPWGVPIEVTIGPDDTLSARLEANALHEGPPECVHGGVAGYLMDCLLGVLIQASGRRAVTARLELDYLAPTPLDRPLDLSARVTAQRGRKIHAEGRIEYDGAPTVRAHGLFVEIDRSPR